jgi:hypothetical protein
MLILLGLCSGVVFQYGLICEYQDFGVKTTSFFMYMMIQHSGLRFTVSLFWLEAGIANCLYINANRIFRLRYEA